MVNLSNYYFNPTEIVACVAVQSGQAGYPYGLRVYLSNREQIQLNYNSNVTRAQDIIRLCKAIELARPAQPVTHNEVEAMIKSAKDALRRDIRKLSDQLTGGAHDPQ